MPPDDYNVAPSTFQPVIRESREDGSREMALMRWGLIPFFTKQLSDVKGVSTINARAESIRTSPTWREPFKKRRCLVPASAFYEWKRVDPKTKQPYAFTVSDASLFAFAGLWDAWKDEHGHWFQSFAIVTTDGQRTDVQGPYPDAGYPPPAGLRPMALPRSDRATAGRLVATLSSRTSMQMVRG